MGVQHQNFGFSVSSRALRNRAAPEKVDPNPIDVHVGHKLRARRTLLGFSQEKVGEAMGLTFQQVQKYERGANRIGASRLWDMSRILNCPVSYFFEELDPQAVNASTAEGMVEQIRNNEDDPLIQRETLELVRAYYNINDYQVRRRIYDLARSLAQMDAAAKMDETAEAVTVS